jgi:hypothetical protein
LDLEILDLASTEIESGELGAIKYLSEITGWDIKKTANFFILLLIFVFDPLAIALVIATNQAFKNFRKKEEVDKEDEHPFYDEIEIPESYFANSTPQVTPQVAPQVAPQVEPEIIEKIVEVPVEVIREVEKIVEVPVEVIKEVPVDRLVEIIREVPVEKIVEQTIEVPYKYYVDENGQVYDEDGNQMEQKLFEKRLEEMEKKILKYKK